LNLKKLEIVIKAQVRCPNRYLQQCSNLHLKIAKQKSRFNV